MSEATAKIRDALFVCSGRFHDIDYARLELLKLFAELPRHRVRVVADYSDLEALAAADYLVTYTCEVLPDQAQTDALRSFLDAGGRWFALHGSNSALAYRKGEGWDAPPVETGFMELLGSQFLAHPPIAPYRVHVSDPEHPLVRGIGPFEAEDELYLCRFFGEHELLLHAEFRGETPGFVHRDWNDEARRPVMYLRRHPGGGEVLYLNLGHARGHYDMRPITDHYPGIERGSWEKPEFKELLRRGIRWAAGELH